MAKSTRPPAPAAKPKPSAKPTGKAKKPANEPVKSKTLPPKPIVKPSSKPSAAKSAPVATKPAAKAAAKPAGKAPAKDTAPTKASGKDASSAKPVASAKAPVKAPAPAKAAPTTAKVGAPSIPVAKPATPKPGLKGKDAVRARILAQRAKPAKPAAFSLDEVLAIAKTVEKTVAVAAANVPLIATKSGKTAPLPEHALVPPKPTTVRAASLADILGFNPKARTSHAENEEAAIPEKFKRYYKLLIELRNHVTGQVDQHSEETLKRSAKEDSGDLSSYGTDGGTDSFDRDFALSLVANEQEALSEIEAAIQRIKSGNYGICENTGQAIPKERLIAVPFTRYTAVAMKEIEKTRYKVRGQTGILGEGEEGGPKMESDGGEE
jgi:RNA polymerase-binding transcription factor DksA